MKIQKRKKKLVGFLKKKLIKSKKDQNLKCLMLCTSLSVSSTSVWVYYFNFLGSFYGLLIGKEGWQSRNKELDRGHGP
ncbi:unnamed protein product [Brassica oleracea]